MKKIIALTIIISCIVTYTNHTMASHAAASRASLPALRSSGILRAHPSAHGQIPARQNLVRLMSDASQATKKTHSPIRNLAENETPILNALVQELKLYLTKASNTKQQQIINTRNRIQQQIFDTINTNQQQFAEVVKAIQIHHPTAKIIIDGAYKYPKIIALTGLGVSFGLGNLYGSSRNEKKRIHTLALKFTRNDTEYEKIVDLLKDPNDPDENNQTALMRAAKEGFLNGVNALLIDGKAEIDATDATNYGKTALHLAIMNKHTEVANVLLNTGAVSFYTGANPRIYDKNGDTALHMAVAAGLDNNILRDLVMYYRVHVDSQNNYGLTPLALAVRKKRAGIAQCLVNHGADEQKLNDADRAIFEQMGITPKPPYDIL